MKLKTLYISKTITWRIIASLTTFLLTWLFFKDDPAATEKATGVTLTEIVLKMIFYYFHEKTWHKIKIDE